MASCTYELECWGEFQIRAIEGIGYPKSSPLAWLIGNRTEVKHRVSRLPAGICTKDFEEYLLVERALNMLGQEYRIVAISEYIAPISRVGKTMTQRAINLGISLNAYRYRLKKIHAEVCRIYNL